MNLTRSRIRRHLSLFLLLAFSSMLSMGCVKIKYTKWIKQPPLIQKKAPQTRIRIDYQASYVEVASDGGREALPSTRFDRVEILSAIAKQWNKRPGAAERLPARVVLFVDLEHAAGDVAGTVLHSIIGVTILMGIPLTCAYSKVLLVVQTQDGQTYFAPGRGAGCTGLYYPQVPQMTALARGVNDALKKLRPISIDRLEDFVPRLTEIPFISKRMLRVGIADRVIWPVQHTRQFPSLWGQQEKPSRKERGLKK